MNRDPAGGPQAAGLFETMVVVDRLPGAAEINRQLREAILARQAEDKGVEISNVGGWHSDTQMLRWGGEPARKLLERIVAAADQFSVDIKAEPGRPRHRWFPEMWANVSGPGASNQFHRHPGAFWSAVYYVDDGYGGSPDRALGGELVLEDPRMPAIRMAAPDLRFRRPGGKPDHHETWMRPQTGRIVMFPAWLSHSVRPYKGTGLRISVAVNLSAVPLGVAS
ncbi:MAG: 2OG-Fe(II) oxygenase family protein [Pseudomonadota bacterium]|nr:2OG-Fe(II) oxygenase family protein [Pseudomonadota bacterium]